MTMSLHKSFYSGLLTCLALFSTAATTLAGEEPIVRDHRSQSEESGPEVRDHRKQPVVRDHRGGADQKLVEALSKAANAALNGPEIKALNINGHEFHVKKATVKQVGETLTISGQISHVLHLRPDDQLYYTIKKTSRGIQLERFDIQRGGIGKYLNYPLALFDSAYYISPINSTIIDMLRTYSDVSFASWESNAELIVASVGVSARVYSPTGTSSQPKSEVKSLQPSGTLVRAHRSN